jgi:uncharacterized protein YjdB
MLSRIKIPAMLLMPAFLSAASSSITLTSSTNPSVFGRAVALTATVTPSTATGSVTFL